MGGGLSISWLAVIRRDRRLFAVVGSLLVLFSVTLPVLAAQGETARQSICSFYGDEADQGPGSTCLACRVAGGCTAPAAHYAAGAEALDVVRRLGTALFGPTEKVSPAVYPALGAGSIRAPPPSA